MGLMPGPLPASEDQDVRRPLKHNEMQRHTQLVFTQKKGAPFKLVFDPVPIRVSGIVLLQEHGPH